MPEPPPDPGPAALPPFIPRCLDCRYDLTGLPDGRCPECGLKFTIANLERLHVMRSLAARDRRKTLRSAAASILFIGGVLFSCNLSSRSSLGGMVAATILYALMTAGGWYLLRAKVAIESSILLVLLVPTLHLASGFALLDYGLTGAIFSVSIALAVVVIAVRGSPLVGGSIVAALGVLLSLWGVVVVEDARSNLAAGHYWSNYDYPAPPRWTPMSNRRALWMGGGVLVFGAALAGVAGTYARRGVVRMRARNKQKG